MPPKPQLTVFKGQWIFKRLVPKNDTWLPQEAKESCLKEECRSVPEKEKRTVEKVGKEENSFESFVINWCSNPASIFRYETVTTL